MIKCKGCNDDTPEHDTLEGYCMLCAAQRIRWVATLRARIDQLEYQEICEDCSAKTELPQSEIGCNASKRIKELEAKIKDYGTHKENCAYIQGLRGQAIEKCDCGLESRKDK